MGFEETIEGIGAIFVLGIFLTIVVPALVEATGVSFPWISVAIVFAIFGIVLAIIKSWMN